MVLPSEARSKHVACIFFNKEELISQVCSPKMVRGEDSHQLLVDSGRLGEDLSTKLERLGGRLGFALRASEKIEEPGMYYI